MEGKYSLSEINERLKGEGSLSDVAKEAVAHLKAYELEGYSFEKVDRAKPDSDDVDEDLDEAVDMDEDSVSKFII